MEAYARYGPALVRKAQRILESRADAEDVVQGLFVDMLRKGEMQGDLPYLYRAVTNRCLNHLRDGSNRRRLEVENAEALRGPARTTLDGIAIGKELLLRLVGRLDERSAEVLVCVFYDDMTQEETAAHLGVSRKTVQKRLDGIRAEVARLAEAK